MAHGTKINGTSYGVTGGKCLVGGTAYDIKKGRTLIGGTGYSIEFWAPTRINVTKETQGYNDTFITVNGGERISSTKTLEFEAGENVILFAFAAGLGTAYPGIITLNGKEVGRAEGEGYSQYEFDCTGHIVDVVINDYDFQSFNGTIAITTE